MNKKNITAVLISLLVSLMVFSSCGVTDSGNEKAEVTVDDEAVVTVTQPDEEEAEQEPEETVVEGEESSEEDQPVTEEPVIEEEKPAPDPLPEEEPVPEHKYQELAEYALELINTDRLANGLEPVELGGDPAAQLHAEDSFTNGFSSHWNLEGLKPYMRYTLTGGVNYVAENVIGTGISTAGTSTAGRDVMELMAEAEERYMESPLHRANILNKWHKTVSIGIEYDDNSFYWVQHFEGDYIGFSTVPTIMGTVFSMAGKLKAGTFEHIVVYYDPLPQPLTPAELNAPPYDSSYSMGEVCGNILPPLPEGSFYTNTMDTDIVATEWISWDGGWFDITAMIGPILEKGPGVYTFVIMAKMNGELVPVSNYSIFIN